MFMRELEKQYNPAGVEKKIYEFWEEGGYFNAEVDPSKEPYTIMIPPPNITGRLHMGHAMDTTLQDILIRQKRMQGYSALWMPGTDHAAIATEAKIVEAMKKEGVSKAELGREGFMERAFAWKEEYNDAILGQLKALGASCDWRRTAFTMDEERAAAVKEAFVSMYEEGLIYRGDRIINWCPNCKTSISDAEVEYEEKQGGFWHVRYELADGSGSITVATTRPETMLGDTGIAVHPEDERYKHLIGKTAILPLVGREIPIVGDEYVEPGFGTGAVKLTPAHDPNDFEVGERHGLEVLKIMTDDAHIAQGYAPYSGMERYEAREKIVAALQAAGQLVKVEEHAHNTGTCYRCATVVEPMVSLQWFVKMEPLAGPAIEAVRNGEVKFVPQRFDKTYFNWMENVKDWCISRQLWWGHRIPAYYCDACGQMSIAREAPHACPQCGNTHLRQDEDSLDTWFSSALWPSATLGWPQDTPEYKYFYPTNTLVTGYDIIFFWVARMIFSGIHHTGKVPFDTVYMHGLVRDSQGRKMSKSLGNGIDPLDVVKEYGADALRYTLATGGAAGADSRYSDEKVKASRNFANKLWNAARFVLMNLPEGQTLPAGLPQELELEDKWVLSSFNTLTKEVAHHFDNFDIGLAGAKIENFIWDIYCDWYIEIAKLRLSGENEEKAINARRVLVYVLRGALQLLHPYMPHITEEIYRALPGSDESIMVSAWPTYT
ncbi:valine--tRNA ligase, partial [Ruminococcaceae bacterium OttesenSCG-928-N02]|nr:valine--tRNA ligase [Ruminococcaceae bacterium OttesenSCG-928-N02]